MLKIKYKNLILVSYAILLMPIVIFFITWLNSFIGISCTILLGTSFYIFFNKYYKDFEKKQDIVIKLSTFVAVVVALSIWVWVAGIGDYFVSGYDWPWRNAIFKDLIKYKWPMIYNNGNGFVYYMFYWLPSAFIAKIFKANIGNFVLYAWTVITVVVIYLNLYHILRPKTYKQAIILGLIFMFWSGLNVIGMAWAQIFNYNYVPFGLNANLNWCDGFFNGYSFNFFYRNNFNFLLDPYNQIPIWLVITLFLDDINIDKFVFIGLLALPFAPLPFIGLVLIMFLFFTSNFIKSIKLKNQLKLFKDLFNLESFLIVLSFIPIFVFFLANSTSNFLAILPLSLFDFSRIFALVMFWLLQFGIISIFLIHRYFNNKLFKIIVFLLIIIPLIEFGKRGYRDFCMNASIPPLFILMIFTIKYLFELINEKKHLEKIIFLTIFLTLGSLSPIGEILLRFDAIGDYHKFPLLTDHANVGGTLEGKDSKNINYKNFLVSKYKDKIFYKYFAKKKK